MSNLFVLVSCLLLAFTAAVPVEHSQLVLNNADKNDRYSGHYDDILKTNNEGVPAESKDINESVKSNFKDKSLKQIVENNRKTRLACALCRGKNETKLKSVQQTNEKHREARDLVQSKDVNETLSVKINLADKSVKQTDQNIRKTRLACALCKRKNKTMSVRTNLNEVKLTNEKNRKARDIHLVQSKDRNETVKTNRESKQTVNQTNEKNRKRRDVHFVQSKDKNETLLVKSSSEDNTAVKQTNEKNRNSRDMRSVQSKDQNEILSVKTNHQDNKAVNKTNENNGKVRDIQSKDGNETLSVNTNLKDKQSLKKIEEKNRKTRNTKDNKICPVNQPRQARLGRKKYVKHLGQIDYQDYRQLERLKQKYAKQARKPSRNVTRKIIIEDLKKFENIMYKYDDPTEQPNHWTRKPRNIVDDSNTKEYLTKLFSSITKDPAESSASKTEKTNIEAKEIPRLVPRKYLEQWETKKAYKDFVKKQNFMKQYAPEETGKHKQHETITDYFKNMRKKKIDNPKTLEQILHETTEHSKMTFEDFMNLKKIKREKKQSDYTNKNYMEEMRKERKLNQKSNGDIYKTKISYNMTKPKYRSRNENTPKDITSIENMKVEVIQPISTYTHIKKVDRSSKTNEIKLKSDINNYLKRKDKTYKITNDTYVKQIQKNKTNTAKYKKFTEGTRPNQDVLTVGQGKKQLPLTNIDNNNKTSIINGMTDKQGATTNGHDLSNLVVTYSKSNKNVSINSNKTFKQDTVRIGTDNIQTDMNGKANKSVIMKQMETANTVKQISTNIGMATKNVSNSYVGISNKIKDENNSHETKNVMATKRTHSEKNFTKDVGIKSNSNSAGNVKNVVNANDKVVTESNNNQNNYSVKPQKTEYTNQGENETKVKIDINNVTEHIKEAVKNKDIIEVSSNEENTMLNKQTPNTSKRNLKQINVRIERSIDIDKKIGKHASINNTSEVKIVVHNYTNDTEHKKVLINNNHENVDPKTNKTDNASNQSLNNKSIRVTRHIKNNKHVRKLNDTNNITFVTKLENTSKENVSMERIVQYNKDYPYIKDTNSTTHDKIAFHNSTINMRDTREVMNKNATRKNYENAERSSKPPENSNQYKIQQIIKTIEPIAKGNKDIPAIKNEKASRDKNQVNEGTTLENKNVTKPENTNDIATMKENVRMKRKVDNEANEKYAAKPPSEYRRNKLKVEKIKSVSKSKKLKRMKKAKRLTGRKSVKRDKDQRIEKRTAYRHKLSLGKSLASIRMGTFTKLK